MDILIELKKKNLQIPDEDVKFDFILPDCSNGTSEYPNHFFYFESGKTFSGTSSIASASLAR